MNESIHYFNWYYRIKPVKYLTPVFLMSQGLSKLLQKGSDYDDACVYY